MDGGTGTEMEKRGVPMVADGWTAASTLFQPETLRQIHEDYIQAGAEVIITNTFASSRHVLEGCGLADKFETINHNAARIAVEARERASADQPVWVAGSLSTGTFRKKQPPPHEAQQNFNDQADILAEAGVDFFALEMMRDIQYTNIVIEAAQRTGLPIWVGYSTVIAEDGRARLFSTDGSVTYLDEALQSLSPHATPLVSIMHTLIEDIQPALDALKLNWSGIMGIYAHCGKFVMPNWQFIDMISPENYAAEAQKWADQGVQMIGGCCGIAPEHIHALKERFH